MRREALVFVLTAQLGAAACRDRARDAKPEPTALASVSPDAAPIAASAPAPDASIAPVAPVAPSLPPRPAHAFAPKRGPHWLQADAWIAERVANAKAGRREIVRLPYYVHGPRYGCYCPEVSVGVASPRDPGLDIEGSVDLWHGVDPMQLGASTVGVVEGYFTGASQKRDSNGSPPVYTYLGFHALHARAIAKSNGGDADSDDDFVYVVLDGEDAKVEPLADERPWLAVVASVPLAEATCDARADATRAKLEAAGFADAQIVDSRQTKELFCCYRVVVAGRFATEKEADGAAAAARKKGFSAYVKKGW